MFYFNFIGDHRYDIFKRRVLQGKSVPHYAAIEPSGDGLMIVSYKPFKFMQDEDDKLEENDDAKATNEKKGKTYLADYDRLLSFGLENSLSVYHLFGNSSNKCLS